MADSHRPHVHVLLFGDQTIDKVPVLEDVVRHSSQSPLLQQFLHKATETLQIEACKLPRKERIHFQDFETLLELARRNHRDPSKSSEVVATVVMCVARLGELIRHAEYDSTVLGSLTAPTEIISFCTGGIPAAVAAAARDVQELLALAIESVAIILRLAFHLVKRSEAIDSVTKPWAVTLVGAKADEIQLILDAFHQAEGIPNHRRLTISVFGQGWLTVFGPPNTLDRLNAWSDKISKLPKVPTDARSAVHTSSLPVLDYATIIGDSSLLDGAIVPKARMISPSTALPYEARNVRDLLQQVLSDISQNPIHVEKAMSQALQPHVQKSITLSVLGRTQHDAALVRMLVERHGDYRIQDLGSKSMLKPSESRSGSGVVAVVGMSGRFPGSDSVDELWKNLLAGKDFITKIPKSRFSLDEYYDPTHENKNSSAACYGAFLEKPGMLDHKLFDLSPREAAQLNPLQGLLLKSSYEALEMAGYKPDTTPSTTRNRVNTYFGQASDDWRDIIPNTEKGTDIYYVPGVSRAFVPSRLSYHFKWGGGSYSIDSACASSTTCVSLACASLLSKDCDMALAGGGSVLQSPYVYAGLSRAGMLSPTGGCKTFRADADGYCRGEGVGVVVLKRLEDALAENDNVVAIIKGASRSHSNTAISMTHPSAEAQERLYHRVLQQSNISANDISYIEMHGTGTQAGDLAEMSSVLGVFTEGREPDNPLTVGSIKANIGHGEAAAGISSLIKTLMVLRTRTIPPQPGLPFRLNPNFPDLASRKVSIASAGMTLQPRRDGSPHRAFVNSFDASGGNTCMALEEAPARVALPEDVRLSHVIVITGKTQQAFFNNRKRLQAHIKQFPETRVADLAYTTTARRMHEALRACYTSKTVGDLLQKLDADIDVTRLPSGSTDPDVTFVCTGQGSQYAQMGRDLCCSHAEFRGVLQAYEHMATSQGLPSFLHLITADKLDIASESPGAIHMALVSLEIAMANLWISWGVKPSQVIGHSLGEYAALCIAGVLSVSDALYLVGRRAALLEEKLLAGSYAMLVVRAGAAEVQEHLSREGPQSCQISLKNSPTMTIVTGPQDDIQKFRFYLKSCSMHTTLLDLPYGFHSKQLDPILDDFEEIAKGVVFSTPSIPVLSTLLAKAVSDNETFGPRYLRDQMRQPVNFVETLEFARTAGYISDRSVFLEVGPQPLCSNFIFATLGATSTRLVSLKQGESAWTTISESIASACSVGCPVDWSEYHRLYIANLTLLDLPKYAFDETDFWTPFIPPPKSVDATSSNRGSSLANKGPLVEGFPNSSLQSIEEWRVEENDTISATFTTSASDSKFREAVDGHTVNGVAIVPAAILIDMAISATQYVQLRLHQGNPLPLSQFSVHSLEITNPVVLAGEDTSPEMSTSASHVKGSSIVAISFKVLSDKTAATCGRCDILIGKASTAHSELSRGNFLVQSRIDALSVDALAGVAHPLSKPVLYRLFENLVKVGPKYRALDSAILGPSFRDASAEVTLSSASRGSTFGFEPYWIDSIVQVSGVLLNSGLHYSDDTAFVSTGLESWYFFEELQPDCRYTSYVQYQELKSDSTIEGDVSVFRENRLVSHLRGVRFLQVKRKVLAEMLSTAPPKSKSYVKARSSDVSKKSNNIPQIVSSISEADNQANNNLTSTPMQPAFSLFCTKAPTNATKGTVSPYGSSQKQSRQLLEIIACESGCSVEDLCSETRFRDLGIDSLMAIAIVVAVRDQMQLELPGSFFLGHDTVGEVVRALNLNASPPQATLSERDEYGPYLDDPRDLKEHDKSENLAHPNSKLSNTKTGNSESEWSTLSDPPFSSLWTTVATPGSWASADPSQPQSRHEHESLTLASKVVHLEGPRPTSKGAVFFIGDETGTIARYVAFTGIGADEISMHGVLSPFVETTQRMEGGIENMASLMAVSIQAMKSRGPYRLVGYSVGGLLAYLIALRLARSGQTIESLILFDPPLPTARSSINAISLEALENMGLIPGNNFSGHFISTIPRNQQEHVRRLSESLLRFQMPVSPHNFRPEKAVFVYPKDGLRGSGENVHSHARSWAEQSWGRHSRDGWKELIPNIEMRELAGDHFSMMEYPMIDDLTPILMEAVKKSTSAE